MYTAQWRAASLTQKHMYDTALTALEKNEKGKKNLLCTIHRFTPENSGGELRGVKRVNLCLPPSQQTHMQIIR